ISKNELILALNMGVYSLYYDEKSKTFSHNGPLIRSRAYTLCLESSSRYIYISTSEGLLSIDSSKKIKEIKFKSKTINALSLYSDGNKTYISTRKNGVLICKTGKIIAQFYPKLNDINLSIFKLIIHKKKLYANTPIGLVVMNNKGTIIRFLNKSSGLS